MYVVKMSVTPETRDIRDVKDTKRLRLEFAGCFLPAAVEVFSADLLSWHS
jgi:hypothetical protein